MQWPDPSRPPQFPHLPLCQLHSRQKAPIKQDWREHADHEVTKLLTSMPLKRGARVGVLVGSRGIANLPEIVAGAVAALKRCGLSCFIVPAMGSHGGGAHSGRVQLLQHYGIEPSRIKAPLLGSDEVITVCAGQSPLLWDAVTKSLDALLPINRVKPHPTFEGPLGSGLLKMVVVGLGGPQGAAVFHAASDLSLMLGELAKQAVATNKVLGGLAILEQGATTARLEGIPRQALLTREPELLREAESLMPKLPLPRLDILLVDRMGKDISGTGMDTHITLRRGVEGEAWPGPIRRIYVRRLSGDGNANGIGLADAVHKDVASAIDWQKTMLNVLTTGFVRRAQLPPVFDTDEAALSFLWRSLAQKDADTLHLAWIKNTLDLDYVWVSAPAAKAVSVNWQPIATANLAFHAGALALEAKLPLANN